MNYNQIFEKIDDALKPFVSEGKISASIPELAMVDPTKFGIHLLDNKGNDYAFGNSDEKFSIQSISKVFSLSLAFQFLGEQIWQRVGVEPSGNPFNSLVQLEYEKGKPRNPFINAGAMVIADILISNLENPKEDFLNFVRKLAHTENIHYNESVALSEKKVGFRNAALANFLKSFGSIYNEVDIVLDFYFHQCSLEMTCKELAHSFYYFANEGFTKERIKILTQSQTKRLNALMQTCGFYDESGEFAYKVGLPGKSGIGGGIIAIHPKNYSVATWGPKLNEKGNSVLGMKALEFLTTETQMSIF